MKVFGKKDNFTILQDEYTSITINYCLEEVNEINATWFSLRFNKIDGEVKFDKVKQLILDSINENAKNNIIKTFKWNNKSIWLSQENQFNYKAAYDLTLDSDGANLPYTIKTGEEDEADYIKINTIEEFDDFYISMINHIRICQKEAWRKKDSIEWSKYKEELNKYYDNRRT